MDKVIIAMMWNEVDVVDMEYLLAKNKRKEEPKGSRYLCEALIKRVLQVCAGTLDTSKQRKILGSIS